MKQARLLLPLLITAISVAFLAVLLSWKWRLGLTRYFDVDEFAYLHWAYQVYAGQKPYVDFFFYVPPGFLWFLMPLFAFGSGVMPIFAARVVSFIVFALLGVSLGVLFWQVRRSFLAVVVPLVLFLLPLPSDKFLEVRPDTLSTLLSVLAMMLLVSYLKRTKAIHFALSGVLYAASLVVLPKSVPFVAVGVLTAIGHSFLTSREGGSKKHWGRCFAENFFPFAMGLLGPLLLFGVWLLTLGNFSQVYYSLVTLPFEVNKISRYFVMMPDLFFYPNGIYYGIDGYSRGLLFTYGVWLLGLGVGIHRLFTPFLSDRGKDGVLTELLIAGSLLVNAVVFVMFIPLRHAQYLIPIAALAAWYVADALFLLWQWAKRLTFTSLGFGFMYASIAIWSYQVFLEVNAPKLSWTNEAATAQLTKIFRTLPKGEYVFDLDGRTMYYPNPHYACCLPMGQYAAFLTRPLPSVSKSLEATKTKYIYQGELKRVLTLLPEDQAYIRETYVPLEAGDETLLVRKSN